MEGKALFYGKLNADDPGRVDLAFFRCGSPVIAVDDHDLVPALLDRRHVEPVVECPMLGHVMRVSAGRK